MALHSVLGVGNIALVYLTAILIDAVLFGLGPSLLACLASVLAYNFFFLPPLYTFTIADPENVVALFFFAVVALIASNLAARVRGQAVTARLRARTTDDLYQFSRKLTVAVTLDDLLWATAHQIALMLKVRVVLLLPESLPPERAANRVSLSVKAGFPPEDVLDEADLAAAKWCWEKNRTAGRGSDTLPGAKWLFQPMRTGRGPLGVVGIIRDEPGPLLTPDQQRLLDSLADQAALGIERIGLARDLHLTRLEVETDRLRSALLTSISHDLRTPLASILGSATSLRSQHAILDEATRELLLGTIIEEADRLNRFIGNLLDMTRLESGALHPHTGLTVLSDVVGAALQRATKILAAHRIEVDLPADLPMLALDMVLFEQVLFNLLDNAARYAPRGSVIRLQAARQRGSRDGHPAGLDSTGSADPQGGSDTVTGGDLTGDTVTLCVIDEGEGIPPADLERIFDKFYRANGPSQGSSQSWSDSTVQRSDRRGGTGADNRRAGTGLGLAICRGFVEAMEGTITAQNRRDRSGAMFVITLPVPADAAMPHGPSAETPDGLSPEETVPMSTVR